MQLHSPAATTREPIVREVIFEALYVRAIQPAAALQGALKRAGYDSDNRRPEYPASVLGQCLGATAAQILPGMSLPQAFQELGRIFVRGILSTLLGKAIGPALFMAGPERVMKRVPALVRSDFGMELKVSRMGPGLYQVVAAPGTPLWSAEFHAGMFEELLRGARAEPSIVVAPPREPSSPFTLEIRWPG
jgi:uncharacterized protein (TIGR02265 family)